MNTFLDPIRTVVRSGINHLAYVLNKLTNGKIHPNQITIIGLLAHIGIAYLISQNNLIVAAILLIIFGLFDSLDGALARLQKRTSTTGMLLDSVTDRVKEVLLYVGIAYTFVATNNSFFAVWAVLACGTSIIVSYINAWGEVVVKDKANTQHKTNKEFRAGFMTFEVRMFCLVAGLLSGYVTVALIVISTLGFITALERFYLITKRL